MQRIYGGSPRAAPHGRGDRAPRQGHRHRPVADRAHPRQPGDLHRRVRPHPRLFADPEAGAGYLPGRFSFNVKGGAAGLRRRRHDQDRDALPAGRVRAVRGCARAPATTETRSTCVTGARTSPRCSTFPCEEALSSSATSRRSPISHADPGRRRPRLRPPRPARPDAVGRRGAAGEARVGAGQAVDRPTLYLLDEPTTGLHFEDIRKLLTVLSTASSTRATPCWSSSTTSTSPSSNGLPEAGRPTGNGAAAKAGRPGRWEVAMGGQPRHGGVEGRLTAPCWQSTVAAVFEYPSCTPAGSPGASYDFTGSFQFPGWAIAYVILLSSPPGVGPPRYPYPVAAPSPPALATASAADGHLAGPSSWWATPSCRFVVFASVLVLVLDASCRQPGRRRARPGPTPGPGGRGRRSRDRRGPAGLRSPLLPRSPAEIVAVLTRRRRRSPGCTPGRSGTSWTRGHGRRPRPHCPGRARAS